jgi:hypothetical protein
MELDANIRKTVIPYRINEIRAHPGSSEELRIRYKRKIIEPIAPIKCE